MPDRLSAPPARQLWLLILLCALGIGLRVLRLEWQPLWWDEGYSVWFATEALVAMLRLTAQDIHPPLYYALLHFWLNAFGSVSPLLLRAFSVLIGALSLPAIWWLARIFFPSRPRVALWALLLLALSPIHIFYSQEVRMYGLELLLGMLSTAFFWRTADGERRTPGSWIGYGLATTALLYTEYYAALLPLAHFVWALWHFRRNLRRMLPLLGGWMAVALAYLPWLLYAVPELIPYISQKIGEDADRPLGLMSYAFRHLLAFTAGQIPPTFAWLAALRGLALFSLFALLALYLLHRLRSPVPTPQFQIIPSPLPLLIALLLLPAGIGFLLNLRLPFFPEGGERVLLFILPYFLLVVASGLAEVMQSASRWKRAAGGLLFWGFLAGAGAGVWTFYTVPRYTDDDYRPLIRQTVQQGSDTDTILAVFPWQIGYWRAYAPVWGRGELRGPWPLLSPSPAWDVSVQAAIDTALERGKLWFPAHLSLGGILEGAVEDYLRAGTSAPAGQATVNFENRWYTPTTRLSGWATVADPALSVTGGDFSVVRLERAGIGAASAFSANEVLGVSLGWSRPLADQLQVTLRLVDKERRVWAQRDYAPLGSWPLPGPGPADWDRVGLLVPVGLPPGEYWLAVGVGPMQEERLYPLVGPEAGGETVSIGALQVRAPASPLPVLRLPIQNPLPGVVTRSGIDFLGASGFESTLPTLAGARMRIALFVRTPQPPTRAWDVYVSLLDGDGNGVAGWEGWPLPDYPLESWLPGTQMRLPVQFYLPASLSPGRYGLVAGLRNPATGEKSSPVSLGALPIVRRAASFAPPTPQHRLEQPVHFGVHATLLGYDSATRADGTVDLTLYWRVEQTLLPPHNVFVHLRDGAGALLAQDDGVPGRLQNAAPSNTWLPGEIIADPHTLRPSSPIPSGSVAQVGFYEPVSGVRLPVSLNQETTGDTFSIPVE